MLVINYKRVAGDGGSIQDLIGSCPVTFPQWSTTQSLNPRAAAAPASFLEILRPHSQTLPQTY